MNFEMHCARVVFHVGIISPHFLSSFSFFQMGAHRFTLLDQNLVVAATDMPDYDDREQLDGQDQQEHYSKTHVKTGIYGLDMLYIDKNKVNENIRIDVNASNRKVKQHL